MTNDDTYTKKEIEYMVNALRAYSIPRDAPRDKAAAWLAQQATQLADLRRDTWIPRSKECVAEWEKRAEEAETERVARNISDYKVHDCQDRVAWHAQCLKKERAQERFFRRLAAKLAAHGLPAGFVW